ncbi:hypothetical protein TRVA0_023S01090 [Trichomonascus vanleenenianus]|uniref:bZIP transcription factor n=1 Tax=Trichomonascus vanleenenianus TaxID=2268995 RepID=UPI003ECA9A1A
MSSVSSTDCFSDVSISPEALTRRALSANHTPMNLSYDFVLMNSENASVVSAPEMGAGAGGGDQLCMFEEKSNPETWSPLFEDSNSPLAKEEPVTPPNLRKRSASEVSTALEEDRARALSLEAMRKKVKLSTPPASSLEKKDLPPVVVQNPNDPAAVRRAKNTEAARRSRAKKNERIEHLEALVSELMSKNSMLEAENAVLRKFHKLAPR